VRPQPFLSVKTLISDYLRNKGAKMKWVFLRKTEELLVDMGTVYNGIPQFLVFHCTSDVRNELNGRRRLHDPREVVRTIPGAYPYMPRPFPVGEFDVTGVKYRDKSDPEYGYLGPAFIQTNAYQMVRIWSLDKVGGYEAETAGIAKDTAYGFHAAPASKTTQGCGRLRSEKDALALAQLVEQELATKRKITLVVKDE